MPAAPAAAGRRATDALALGIPLVVLLAGAWSRRWMSDDGFINLRIVEQLWAGNGPVWNPGERVETGTSPLWLAVLAAAGGVARSVPVEWVAVGIGIAATLGGLAAAMLAARELHDADGSTVVPLGAVVVAALPAMWDFASSGLETGLTFLWLGTGGWALVRAVCRPPAWRRAALTAVLLGLGPLVRPDLALVAAPLLLALVVGSRALGRARVLALAAVAGALPVAYQLFRMAFFAALVPNTAFAKEGGRSSWGPGWDYAADHVGTWRLWWPAIVLAAVAAVELLSRRRVGRGRALVIGAITVGALLHGLYVVRVGGDFMHARLLLPATFALAVPWAVVPLRRETLLALGALVPWAVLAATVWVTAGQRGDGPATGLVDERAYYVGLAGEPHPVTAEDFGGVAYASGGRRAAAVATAGERALTLATTAPDDRSTWMPLARSGNGFTVAVDNVGVFGFLAGPDVTVVDLRGLGDPVTSRFRLVGERGRPGHEKNASPAWVLGRHMAEGATPPPGTPVDPTSLGAARDALRCGRLADVLDGITEPLTPGRAIANLGLALTTYDLRVDPDPVAARAELCG